MKPKNHMIGEVMYVDNFAIARNQYSRVLFEKRLSILIILKLTSNILLKTIERKYTDIVTDWEKKPNIMVKASAILTNKDLLKITIYKRHQQKRPNTLSD